MVSSRIPRSTYRFQFNSGFGFEDARSVVSYLNRLGISDIYASPIFQARRGSTHGYDVTDPTQLNAELGSSNECDSLIRELKSNGMGLLLDIVPNHMAASNQNFWWLDVLENGPESPYASFFDIDWAPTSGVLTGKVLLPTLGSPYALALENQELALSLDDGDIHVRYYETKLPVNTKGCAFLATHRLDSLASRMADDPPTFRQLQQIIDAIQNLPVNAYYDAARSLKLDLQNIIESSPKVRAHVDENIQLFNGVKGEPASFDLLDGLLSMQFYRLAFWKQASEAINYRRFFDIADLAGLRVEDGNVFEASHALTLRLIGEGAVTGLRLDHIDGLRDPFEYLTLLQSRIASETQGNADTGQFYVVAEKILAGDETVRPDWPISGTSGYDFLNAANALFVNGENVEKLRVGYQRFVGLDSTFADVAYQKKKQVINSLFLSELETLADRLSRLAQQDRYGCDIPRSQLTMALIEVTACMPVYRSYIRSRQVDDLDRNVLESALDEATKRCPHLEGRTLDFIRRTLMLDISHETDDENDSGLDFVMRWQQFTGPVMAKGVEDTALYNYNFLISLNDVGGEPDAEHFGVDSFHQFNLARQSNWPRTMNATSTHDTKRSEDVRARINVLSEIPEEWNRRAAQWSQWNDAKKAAINGTHVPDANTEWFIYQTMLGARPLVDDEIPEFRERLKAYMVKAAREAKLLTSWLSPDEKNESALAAFVDSILEPSPESRFLPDFRAFQERVAFHGALNSLSQVLLKATSPGVPDFYRGTELWDFSLVDPDNRRPVDFNKREELLSTLMGIEDFDTPARISELLDNWRDGRVKLYLTHKVLRARSDHRDVFSDGDYIPLRVQGMRDKHVTAFARRSDDSCIISVGPRLTTGLTEAGCFPLGSKAWGDDTLTLPNDLRGAYVDLLTNETVETSSADGYIRIADLFSMFPLALLVKKT